MAFITFYVENVQNIYEFIAIFKNLLNHDTLFFSITSIKSFRVM